MVMYNQNNTWQQFERKVISLKAKNLLEPLFSHVPLHIQTELELITLKPADKFLYYGSSQSHTLTDKQTPLINWIHIFVPKASENNFTFIPVFEFAQSADVAKG